KALRAVAMWFRQTLVHRPDSAGTGSTDYMHLFGLGILGYMWAKMAKAAEDGRAAGDAAREDYLKNKLVTARVFMERLMP
ncbi:acyl-CoA dehydrogenase C-terminal domain-containing protein, partial [Rhizobium ruizarguesonis]